MGLSLSQEAVNVMNSFVMDMFGHIAEEATPGPHQQALHHHSREIETSCALAAAWGDGHVVSEATNVVIKYVPLADRLTLTTGTL